MPSLWAAFHLQQHRNDKTPGLSTLSTAFGKHVVPKWKKWLSTLTLDTLGVEEQTCRTALDNYQKACLTATKRSTKCPHPLSFERDSCTMEVSIACFSALSASVILRLHDNGSLHSVCNGSVNSTSGAQISAFHLIEWIHAGTLVLSSTPTLIHLGPASPGLKHRLYERLLSAAMRSILSSANVATFLLPIPFELPSLPSGSGRVCYVGVWFQLFF